LDDRSNIDFPATSALHAYLVHEEIRGPVYGYWLASYAIERSRGFYAYGKLCKDRPGSVWDTPTAFLKIALGPRPTADAALDAIFGAIEARLQRRRENPGALALPPLA
jgi:hypothetical protein